MTRWLRKLFRYADEDRDISDIERNRRQRERLEVVQRRILERLQAIEEQVQVHMREEGR